MAVAYVSQQEASETGDAGGTLTVTKPIDLAVGDMMLALLWGRRSASDWATLSGWTKLGSCASGDGTDSNLTIQAKVADSGDVAASNFTFTAGASQEEKKIVLMRITGDFSGGLANLHVIDTDTDVNIGSAVAGGVTPIGANSLLVMGVTANASQTFSGYSVANNNPTWTERVDGNVGGATILAFAAATATFSPASATGNYTITSSGGGIVAGTFLLAISETTNVTVTPNPVTMTASVPSPSVTGDANVSPAVVTMTSSVQAPTVSAGTAKWVNTDKSAAGSITNTDKS